MGERIKVNFTVTKESKKILDEVNKASLPGGKSRSDIIDTLLRFDEKAAELFLEIFKLINHEKKFNDYVSLNNGGVVLNKQFMEQVELLKLSNIENKEDANISYGEYHSLIENGTLNVDKLVKKLETLEKAILSVHFNVKELEKK